MQHDHQHRLCSCVQCMCDTLFVDHTKCQTGCHAQHPAAMSCYGIHLLLISVSSRQAVARLTRNGFCRRHLGIKPENFIQRI